MNPNNAQNNQPPAPVNPSPIPGDGNDPSQPVMPPPNQSPAAQGGGKKKMVIIMVVVLVLLAVAGALVFSMSGNDGDKDEAPAKPSQNQEAPAQTDATEPSTDTTTDSDAQSGEVAVSISNFVYTPGTLTVKKGSTVTWTNNDSVAHTVTSDSESPKSGLDSELFGKGETFEFTFNEVGVFKYHCAPHPSMTASVEVVEQSLPDTNFLTAIYTMCAY